MVNLPQIMQNFSYTGEWIDQIWKREKKPKDLDETLMHSVRYTQKGSEGDLGQLFILGDNRLTHK